MRTLLNVVIVSFVLYFIPHASGQTYIGRYDAYAGFMYLDSPHVDLAERGFHMQAGFRPKTWYSLGFDYSVSTGHTSITPNLLTNPLRQQLGVTLTQLAGIGLVPPNYSLTVPIDSLTQTFAAGPQLAYRRWPRATLFVRPSFGAIHETATPHTTDPVETLVVTGLAPSGVKKDWTGFYGFGGGVDLNFTKHVSVRLQADFVRDHLFSDLLGDSRNTVRLSIGPALQFGRDISK